MATTMALPITIAGGFELHDLHSAAKQGDIVSIVRLLEEGASVDKRDPYGYSPLHWASQKGYTHVVHALLAGGADPNVRDKWRRTPLHRASKEGHKDIVAALIKAGAEVNAQGDSNWTPLHCSSFHGQVEVVQMLLQNGADRGATDVRGRNSAAVCDIAGYEVDQGSKARIQQMLRGTPSSSSSTPMMAQPGLEMHAVPVPANNLIPATPDNASPECTPGLEGGAVAGGGDGGPAALQTNQAAAAAAAAATSAANAALAAETGVFALWNSSLGEGEGGREGAVPQEGDVSGDDALWQEMWAALHVPDPDNPENNLYTEVKSLRRDLKRLRSDLSDTTSDQAVSSIISALTPTAPQGAAGSAPAILSPYTPSAGFATMASKLVSDYSGSSAEAGGPSGGVSGVPDGGDGNGKQGSGVAPSVKRQRAAGVSGGDSSAPPQDDDSAAGDHGEGRGAGSSSEQQLREQLQESTRRMAEMMKEMARLREQLAAHEARDRGLVDGAGTEAMEQESPPANDGRDVPRVADGQSSGR